MKTFYNCLIIFLLLVMMFGCNKANDHNEPKVIVYTFTTYSLAGTSCDWAQFDVDLSNINRGEVIVIKDDKILKDYMVSKNGIFPTIDFSKNTLLLVRGYTNYGISTILGAIQQLETNVFQLDIEINVNTSMLLQPWTMAYITNQWSEKDRLELNVTFFQEQVECGDEIYFYGYKGKESLDHLFLNDWLCVAFDKKVQNDEIINFLDSLGLFHPVDTYFIQRPIEVNPQKPYYYYYTFVWVNFLEHKTCSKLKATIRLLESYPLVGFANFAFCNTVSDCKNKLSFSHGFSVEVNDENDLTDLYAIVQETHTYVEDQDKNNPRWFQLSADKFSKGNAMQMSNYFFETGKFRSVSLNFVGTGSLVI